MKIFRIPVTAWLVGLFLYPALAFASGGSPVFTKNTLIMLVVLTGAKVLGFLSVQLKMPELVGELFAGIILGNLFLFGIRWSMGDELLASEFMQYAAELSIVILLFQVGLESNIKELFSVGKSAILVAVVGVVLPVFGGWGFSEISGFSSGIGSWFIGATLAATSVGITAKVLTDANVIKTKSSQVILGAAVVDDVLGLILLAGLAAIATTGEVSPSLIGGIFLKAIGFFAIAGFVGVFAVPKLVRVTSVSESSGLWVAFSLVLALLFAQAAAMLDLAPIIGAFTAGLLLDDVHFVSGHKVQKHNLEEMLRPLNELLLPIFFVSIGVQVKLNSIGTATGFGIFAVLVLISIVSKGVAGFAARGEKMDPIGIGLGMIPRGEVGLIFASYALSHRVFSDSTYSIMVITVLFTTVLGPILLRPRLAKF